VAQPLLVIFSLRIFRHVRFKLNVHCVPGEAGGAASATRAVG